MRQDLRRWVVLPAMVATLGACGSPDAPDRRSDPEPVAPPGGTTTTASGGPSDVPTTEETVHIDITIGGQRFTAILDDSAAADDLLAQLPVTIEMTDHGGVEKTGRLPSPLSLDGQPEGTDPDVGDLGYYAPGNDLVLYYGDQSFFPGIVVLGRLDADAPAGIAAITGRVTATIEEA
jgi:hypothetical protein